MNIGEGLVYWGRTCTLILPVTVVLVHRVQFLAHPLVPPQLWRFRLLALGTFRSSTHRATRTALLTQVLSSGTGAPMAGLSTWARLGCRSYWDSPDPRPTSACEHQQSLLSPELPQPQKHSNLHQCPAGTGFTKPSQALKFMDSRAVGTLRFQLCFLSCKATGCWLGSHPGLCEWAAGPVVRALRMRLLFCAPPFLWACRLTVGLQWRIRSPFCICTRLQLGSHSKPLQAVFMQTTPGFAPRSVLWSPGFSTQTSQMAQKVKDPPAIKETWVQSLVQKKRSRRKWQPTPVSLPGKSHEQGSLGSCSPKGFKELDTAEHLCAPADVLSGWGLQWDGLGPLCGPPSALLVADHLLRSLPSLWSSLSPHWSPLLVKRFPVSRNISSFIVPSQGYRSCPNSPFLSFLLPCYVVIFLAFWFYELFCQYLAGILWVLFYIQICLWEEVSSMSFYCIILLWSLLLLLLFLISVGQEYIVINKVLLHTKVHWKKYSTSIYNRVLARKIMETAFCEAKNLFIIRKNFFS